MTLKRAEIIGNAGIEFQHMLIGVILFVSGYFKN
jgi:hypothetical protein